MHYVLVNDDVHSSLGNYAHKFFFFLNKQKNSTFIANLLETAKKIYLPNKCTWYSNNSRNKFEKTKNIFYFKMSYLFILSVNSLLSKLL